MKAKSLLTSALAGRMKKTIDTAEGYEFVKEIASGTGYYGFNDIIGKSFVYHHPASDSYHILHYPCVDTETLPIQGELGLINGGYDFHLQAYIKAVETEIQKDEQLKGKNIVRYFPIAESRDRAHYVLGILEGTQLTIYDSISKKNLLRKEYDVHPAAEFIGQALNKPEMRFTVKHIGKQIDGWRCGYYVTQFFHNFLHGNPVEAVTNRPEKGLAHSRYAVIIDNEETEASANKKTIVSLLVAFFIVAPIAAVAFGVAFPVLFLPLMLAAAGITTIGLIVLALKCAFSSCDNQNDDDDHPSVSNLILVDFPKGSVPSKGSGLDTAALLNGFDPNTTLDEDDFEFVDTGSEASGSGSTSPSATLLSPN